MVVAVRVEFFGIPRQRAGVATAEVQCKTLGDVLHELAVRFPAFGESCVERGKLKTGFLANINGERFTRDPSTRFRDGDAVLILSADVGG